MIYPYEYYGLFYPRIPVTDMRPPTLYSILESVVNYGKEVPTKIGELAKEGRGKIFDFDSSVDISNTNSVTHIAKIAKITKGFFIIN